MDEEVDQGNMVVLQRLAGSVEKAVASIHEGEQIGDTNSVQ